ncbi:immunoglobulin-like domain-containing protein, partial [Listeria booriae]|uniref:immunoglobulin-like domain-containing protein n=1 Tax=Listeria booriae TaxID=1552123 RepID=UPI00164D0323
GTGINGAIVTITIGSETYTGTVTDGRYSVTIPKQAVGTQISAKQSLNGQTSSSVNTTVTQGTVAAPVISPVTSDDTKVKGTGIKGAVVTLTIDGHDYTGLVDDNGDYSITIVKQPAGTTITAKQEINSKVSSNATATVTQGAVTPPTVNPVTTDDTAVTGTGMKGATVKLTIGGIDYTGTVDNDGNYSIAILKQPAGTVITATETLNGKTSSATIAAVTQGTVAAPTINSLTTEDTTARGTGITGAVVTITIGSNTYTGTVTNGEYAITIPKQAAGTVVNAKQTLNDKTSANASTTVTQGSIAAPTVGAVTTDSTTVTGTGVVGATVTVTIGSTPYTGAVAANGTYSITIPKQPFGTAITVKQALNGKTSANASTTVAQGTVAAPTISAVTTDDTTVKGTGIAGATVTVTIGSTPYTGTVAANGTYSITIPKQAAGTVISVKQTLNSKTSTAVNTTVAAVQTTLTANSFTIGVDGYIKGTYTGSSVNKLAIEVNGTIQQKITVTGSPYQYYAKGKVTSATDQVYVISYNANGDQLKRVKVDIKTLSSGTITPATFYVGKDNYVTGTLTGDISKFSLTINGVETTRINVTTAPTFRYYANNLIRNLTDVVTVNGYDSAGKLLDSKPVTVDENRGNQGAIATVATFTLGKDSYVTGTYTGDIAKVELQVNNVALQRITVPKDGTIKYYAKGKINALTDVVKLVGYDSTGVAVSTKVITVSNAGGSITANPYVIGADSYVKGTYTGDVAKVSLTVNGDRKTIITVPVPGPNYQYYAKGLIINATDVVVVTAYDVAGGVLDTKTVSVSKR